MNEHQKRWNDQEKIKIVQYANEHGTGKACVEFNVSSSALYRWMKGVHIGTAPQTELNTIKQELKELKRENSSLRDIVTDQILEIKIKNEIIKKKILKENL